MILKTTVI